MLNIPEDADCIVPGCGEPPMLSLSIRLRRTDTTAVWAPECHAYVCFAHGIDGANLRLDYEPRSDGTLRIAVEGRQPRRDTVRMTSVRR